jgi:ABC-2 type transport system ATP-binding protein
MEKTDNLKVEVKELTKTFGSLKAVDNVSFTLTSGEVHGFIGPNGAGKTTTMRIMATLDIPNNGDVLVNDLSVLNYPDKIRTILGFMPDYLDTYKDVMVNEYLDFYARAYRLPTRYRKKRLNDVVEFTGLKSMLDKPIDGLSKGMKQRLSLGRILVNDPAVLILDEPAAGLDPRARVELRTLCRKLADRGKAVLISSHILTELSEICDSVTIIESGKVQATNTVKNILHEVDSGTRVAIRLNLTGDEESDKTEIYRLMKVVAEHDGVTDVKKELNGLFFSYNGEEKFRVKLLKNLINENFAVMDFHTSSSDLEDVFMSITEGKVN